MTLANVTISSGTVTITNVAVTTANVSGIANISTLVVTANASVAGNVAVTGNVVVTGNVTSATHILTGGTANGVVYLDTTKALTTGSALTFDGTNFTSPRAQFTTAGTPPASGAGIEVVGGTSPVILAYNRGTSAYLPFTQYGSAFTWSINGVSSDLILTSTGLGIGATNPTVKLQINQTTGTNGLRILSSNATTQNMLQMYHTDTYAVIETSYLGSGAFKDIGMQTQGGNVGIGTSSPADHLEVSGTGNQRIRITTTSASYSSSLWLRSNSKNAYVYNYDGELNIANDSGAIVFGTSTTSATERARITSGGYLSLKYPTWNGPLINSGSGNVVSVASGGTINLTVANAGAVLICVYDTSSGNGGVFFGSYTTTITKIAGDGSATDAGSDIAVYKTASSHTITFKNRYATTRDFNIGIYSANALP
jgi:hypothetical protein